MKDALAEYIDVATASRLLGVTPRAVRKRISEQRLTSVRAEHTAHAIPLGELPLEAQLRYQQTQTEGAAEADLTGYRERYGEEGLQKLMGRLRAVQELALLKGDKRSAQRRAELAEALGVKPRCITTGSGNTRPRGWKD